MSRYRLSWYEFIERPNGDCYIKLPLCPMYSPMIDAAFPDVRHIGWRPATKTACWTVFKGAGKEVANRLQGFLELLKESWLLRLNKTIGPHFNDELDQCFALDFNFADADSHTYTGIGQLEYAAKYQRDKGSIDKLADLSLSATVTRTLPR